MADVGLFDGQPSAPMGRTSKKVKDYDAFVEKFKRKKTTDDCYTPAPVYDAVVAWVKAQADLTGREIIRPFWPDTDYRTTEYPKGCVVIDNPPFSIITKICRFYIERGIDFFLFAPHLTLFTGNLDVTHIASSCSITYENGAVVRTSFLTTLLGDIRVMSAPELNQVINAVQRKEHVSLPAYSYPPNVLMVSDLAKFSERGIPFQLHKSQCSHARALDMQRAQGKGLFGSGFLISDKAAAEKAAAEKAAAEKAAAEKAAAKEVTVWELSAREKEIIKNLK